MKSTLTLFTWNWESGSVLEDSVLKRLEEKLVPLISQAASDPAKVAMHQMRLDLNYNSGMRILFDSCEDGGSLEEQGLTSGKI